MNILVIGSANVDYTIETDKQPQMGETVEGKNLSVNSGGKGLNQAVAISKLGGKVSFLGAVGCDNNSQILLDALKEYNVKFVGIKHNGLPTGSAFITIVKGDNSIILNQGANSAVTPDFIEKNSDLITTADYVVLQLEIPIQSIIKICDIAKSSNTKIVLNPAPFKELPCEIFDCIDYIIPNEHEARALTGITPSNEENCEKAIKKLKNSGFKNIIITLGENGCVYSEANEENCHFVPAIKNQVIDTTSAGDSFIGATVTQLSLGKSLQQAINFATRVASITVSRKGAAKSIPRISEIN